MIPDHCPANYTELSAKEFLKLIREGDEPISNKWLSENVIFPNDFDKSQIKIIDCIFKELSINSELIDHVEMQKCRSHSIEESLLQRMKAYGAYFGFSIATQITSH